MNLLLLGEEGLKRLFAKSPMNTFGVCEVKVRPFKDRHKVNRITLFKYDTVPSL